MRPFLRGPRGGTVAARESALRRRIRAGVVIAVAFALTANPGRDARALDGGQASLVGTTGYWNTPSAEVTPDAAFRIGYQFIDRRQSVEAHGRRDNEVYFFTTGFLPDVEITIRATVIPGEQLLEGRDAPPADRMGCARLRVHREGKWPALAVGIDDFKGTKRFHSLYAVATKSFRPRRGPIDLEASAGYGSRALKAARHLLDGGFGALEVRAFRTVSGIIEHDTERWNAGARVTLFRRVSAQAVWQDIDALSGGGSVTLRF